MEKTPVKLIESNINAAGAAPAARTLHIRIDIESIQTGGPQEKGNNRSLATSGTSGKDDGTAAITKENEANRISNGAPIGDFAIRQIAQRSESWHGAEWLTSVNRNNTPP